MSLDEDVNEQPDVVNVDNIIICEKMWEMCTVPGMWVYAGEPCYKCDGFNEGCKYYDPINMD